MTDRTISIWKVEEFLIDNLKQVSTEDCKYKLEANCSLKDFLMKLEETV